MENTILISASVANFSEFSNNLLLNELKVNFPNNEIRHKQRPFGKIYNSAFDWQLISQTGDVLGIISFIWMVYDKFIGSKKEDKSSAGIVLNITIKGKNNTIWIGNQVNTEAELIKTIREFIQNSENQ